MAFVCTRNRLGMNGKGSRRSAHESLTYLALPRAILKLNIHTSSRFGRMKNELGENIRSLWPTS